MKHFSGTNSIWHPSPASFFISHIFFLPVLHQLFNISPHKARFTSNYRIHDGKWWTAKLIPSLQCIFVYAELWTLNMFDFIPDRFRFMIVSLDKLSNWILITLYMYIICRKENVVFNWNAVYCSISFIPFHEYPQ